ncbi:MAG: complex I NDUFA9 subunit family protein, partial [Brachymonas sp.]
VKSPVKTYELAGPETLSLRQLVSLAGQCVGAQRTIIALPKVLARCQALVMEKLPGPTLMSRDNLASMQVPNVASGSLPGLNDLGIQASSIHAIAPRYLQPANRLDAFRKHASR